jgi:mannose/cellobiose epimerase-like protein (N-acyl-D-glucosamine 2-epimerase family)
LSFITQNFEDSEKGGLFHNLSEDFSRVLDRDKHVEDQFNDARIHVIGAMISHDPEAIADAEKAVDTVMERFEDKTHGGYFLKADRDWRIIDKHKSLAETEGIFGIFMHLYEVSKNDAYLLHAIQFLDTAVEKGWDNTHGGFFSLYQDSWAPAVVTKDLATQAGMLQHMNGAWKDGVDSPYGARAAYYKKRGEEFADLILEKASDRQHGGFFTSFTKEWKPLKMEKDLAQIASFALTLYFQYHNAGPSIWGPRRGSHAYTGRPYPATYRYLGPAPSLDPVSEKAFRYGQTVIDTADLLITKGWDAKQGGFYAQLTADLAPADERKLLSTQLSCLMALNVAFRLSGFERFKDKIIQGIKIIEDKCFDEQNGGAYNSFDRGWQPLTREKICGPNLLVNGILSMLSPITNNIDVTRETLYLAVEPQVRNIRNGQSAQFTVTVQNQGFAPVKTRIGGLSTPTRWMQPGEMIFDLSSHEVKSYTVVITPPEGMPPGTYYFEFTAAPAGELAEYVAAGGKVIIT